MPVLLDVLDGDEEQDFVLSALARADGDEGAAFHAGVDERVAREGAFGGDLPAEQVGEELTGGIGVWERISAWTTG